MPKQHNPVTPYLRDMTQVERVEFYSLRNTRKLRKLKRDGGQHLCVHFQAPAVVAMRCVQLHTSESKRALFERLIAQEAARLGPFHFEHEE